jgi:hypothetical protein
VLVDPVRARQIVCERGFGGFSAKIAYIFMKQLEEADVICLSPTRSGQVAAIGRLLHQYCGRLPPTLEWP